tara:strand:- start:437 stop:745 length:309 start_codon:yes stop_codon:yes gene_type:complete
MLGYTSVIKSDVVIGREPGSLDITLSPSPLELVALIVSDTKRAKSFVDAPTSVSELEGKDFQGHNSVSLDESLDYVPGVHMVSSQVSIRGSSEFSRRIGVVY